MLKGKKEKERKEKKIHIISFTHKKHNNIKAFVCLIRKEFVKLFIPIPIYFIIKKFAI